MIFCLPPVNSKTGVMLIIDFTEKTIEMRIVKRTDIIDYFIKTGGKELADGKIAGDNWEAEIGKESPVKLGSFKISAVKVTFRCKKEFFEKMYNKFCLAFLRAGG